MVDQEVSVLVGGRAGDGISSAGQAIAHLLGQLGYRVYMYFDYPSRIKGGHNVAVVRAAGGKIGAVRHEVDFILALNQETLALHRERLREDGAILFSSDAARSPEGIGVPIKEILKAEQAPPVMGNSAMFGAFARAAGIDWTVAEAVLKKAIPKGIEQNLRVARQAYDAVEVRKRIPPREGPKLPVVTGNEAMGIGLAEGGLSVYFGYPMSPTSNLQHFLAGYTNAFHIREIQPESEIAVILMALGCAYAGTRAAVGTSGGGFCLMTEALSLAGVAELPVLVVLGQRAGPSTGLATYTAQSDLTFALGAGQGDFPRLIVAPGDAEEARIWATIGLDLAWKYQLPAILLADRILCESVYSLDPGAVAKVRPEPVLAEGDRPYDRYAITESGISPLRFPPVKGELIRVNSHVHDPDGITTEEPEVTKAMADKRMRKLTGLQEEIEGMDPVQVGGDPEAATAILCWGSNKGICTELGAERGLRVVQPLVLWPFPETGFRKAMEEVEWFVAVESNESGQLARLLRQFGYVPAATVLKYDGRPFLVDELAARLQEALR